MNDPEAIQRKLQELDAKLEVLTQRTLAYTTTILQILYNQRVVSFREMLHTLNQNEKDFSKTPASTLDREFIRLMKPLWDDPEWGNGIYPD
mgnify:FL=1